MALQADKMNYPNNKLNWKGIPMGLDAEKKLTTNYTLDNSLKDNYQTIEIKLNAQNGQTSCINIQVPRFQSTGATLDIDLKSQSFYDRKGNKIYEF